MLDVEGTWGSWDGGGVCGCLHCVCVGSAGGNGAEWTWQWGVPWKTSTFNVETTRDGTQSTCSQKRCGQLSGDARTVSG